MYSIRSIDVISCAKMMAAVHGCLSLLFIPFFLIFGLASLLLGPNKVGGIAAIGLGLVFAVVLPLFYAAMGFLIGALGAWIYNFVARRIGGIRLEFAAPESAQVAPFGSASVI